jgi:hypothetical protein
MRSVSLGVSGTIRIVVRGANVRRLHNLVRTLHDRVRRRRNHRVVRALLRGCSRFVAIAILLTAIALLLCD